MGPAMRQRAMTGETCSSLGSGSFAAYLSDNNKYYTQEYEHPSMPTTPVVSDIDDQEEEQGYESPFPAPNDAVEAVEQLTQGIRIITRQMKQAHANVPQQESPEEETDEDIPRERSWSDACSTIQSCTSQDELRLASIVNQLQGTLGADLMSLAHAAQMVGENSRMASQEASESVRDVQSAHESIQQAQERTKRAESAVRIMYKKQKDLIGQLEQAKNERNVLKRQVKALLQEKSVLKEQEHVARALELHVVSAIQAHEQQLASQQAKRREEIKSGEPENVATVRLECALPNNNPEVLDDKVVHDEHFGVESNQDEKSAEQLESSEAEKFVDVVAEKAETKEVAKPEKQGLMKQHSVGLGLSSAIGFVGGIGLRSHQGSSRTKKEKSSGLDATIRSLEKSNENESKKNVETTNETRGKEATLISPTNSVENDHAQEAEATKEATSVPPSGINDASISTDGISPCNQASLISPSPTENSTVHRKGFFHRSNKEHRSKKEQRPNKDRRPTKANSLTSRKPLLQLDDCSVGATEGSPDNYASACETVPVSDTTAITATSSSNTLTCDVNDVPPTSLSCSTADDQVSPFTHDYATGSATSVLDDHAFRSLAVPSFVAPSPQGHVDVKVPLESPTCPPELAEIAAIYAEIGQLHEC